jgi:hypothetical protein
MTLDVLIQKDETAAPGAPKRVLIEKNCGTTGKTDVSRDLTGATRFGSRPGEASSLVTTLLLFLDSDRGNSEFTLTPEQVSSTVFQRLLRGISPLGGTHESRDKAEKAMLAIEPSTTLLRSA